MVPNFVPSYTQDALLKPVSLETIMDYENRVTDYTELVLPIKLDLISPLTNRISDLYSIDPQLLAESDYRQPAEQTYNNALSLVCSLYDEYLFHLRTEDINLTSYGTFTLDFYFSDDLLSIEIGTDKIGYYLKSRELGNKILQGANFNGEEIPSEIISVFEELLCEA